MHTICQTRVFLSVGIRPSLSAREEPKDRMRRQLNTMPTKAHAREMNPAVRTSMRAKAPGSWNIPRIVLGPGWGGEMVLQQFKK
jgi:hypothetical protein